MSYDSWLTTDTREYYDEDAVEERVKELTSVGGEYDYRTFDAVYNLITSLTAEQAKKEYELVMKKAKVARVR